MNCGARKLGERELFYPETVPETSAVAADENICETMRTGGRIEFQSYATQWPLDYGCACRLKGKGEKEEEGDFF